MPKVYITKHSTKVNSKKCNNFSIALKTNLKL